MKLLARFFVILLSATTLTACIRKLPDPEPRPIPKNWVNLHDPQVGQQSTFVRYTSSCKQLHSEFSYSGDTLILAIEEFNGLLMLTEHFTPGSPLYQDGNTDTTGYEMIPQNERILLPDRWNSSLFFFYGNDTIHLNPSNRVPLIQSSCLIDLDDEPFIGNEIGLLPTFKIGSIEQEDKTVVSCVPMILDVDAFLFYDDQYLYQSHVVTGEEVRGWVAI